MRRVKFGIVAMGLMTSTMIHAQENGNGDKIFGKLDLNSDGHIDLVEFKTAKGDKTKSDGTPIDVEKIFAKKDLNSDQKIDRAEFDKARAERAAKVGVNRFEKMDTNGDGGIDKAELTVAKEGKTKRDGSPIDIDKAFAKKDLDKNGSISKAELEAAKAQKAE